MASATAARSFFRSTAALSTAARFVSDVKAARSSVRLSRNKPGSHRTFRFAVSSSFCVESLLPHHSVTASALMTSMLSISSRYGLLPERINWIRSSFGTETR